MFSNLAVFSRVVTCNKLLLQFENCILQHDHLISSKGFSHSSHCCQEEQHYDVHTYQISLPEEDKLHILKSLNTATEDQFISYNLSRVIARKLLSARKRKHQFNDIKDLILIDGIGLKKIELICQRILHSEAPTKRPTTSVGRVKLIEPKIPDSVKVSNVVGVVVKSFRLSWCQIEKTLQSQVASRPSASSHPSPSTGTSQLSLNPSNDKEELIQNYSNSNDHVWCVRQLNSHKILDFKSDFVDILTGVRAVVDEMPDSDVYILPELHTVTKGSVSPFYFALAHIYGLLPALLNRKAARKREAEALLGNSKGEAAASSHTLPVAASPTQNPLPLAACQSPGVVYFTQEKKLFKSMQMQLRSENLQGVPVLQNLLTTGGASAMGASSDRCSHIEVPPIVASAFRGLNCHQKTSVAAALCTAVAYPATCFK